MVNISSLERCGLEESEPRVTAYVRPCCPTHGSGTRRARERMGVKTLLMLSGMTASFGNGRPMKQLINDGISPSSEESQQAQPRLEHFKRG